MTKLIQEDELVPQTTQPGRNRAGNSSGLRPRLCLKPLSFLLVPSHGKTGTTLERGHLAAERPQTLFFWPSDFLSPADFCAQVLSCPFVLPSPVHSDSPVQGRPLGNGGGNRETTGDWGMVFPGGRNTVCLMLSVEHREGVTAVSKETQV